MTDVSHCKVHLHASGAKDDNQDMSCTKECSTPRYTWLWMRMVVSISEGTRVDCKEASTLIKGFADREYDTNAISRWRLLFYKRTAFI